MAEVNLSAEQLNKLKAAMARAKGLDPQAALQPAAPAQPAAAGETKPAPETAAETAVAVETRTPPTESNLAEGTYLRIEEDEMAAWLYLTPPAEGQTYTKRDLENYLELNGVVKGYHSSNLSAMVKKKVYDREILVAKGADTTMPCSSSSPTPSKARPTHQATPRSSCSTAWPCATPTSTTASHRPSPAEPDAPASTPTAPRRR